MAKVMKAHVVKETTRQSDGEHYFALEIVFDNHKPVTLRMSDHQYSNLLASIVGRDPLDLFEDAHDHPAMGLWLQQVCDKINQ